MHHNSWPTEDPREGFTLTAKDPSVNHSAAMLVQQLLIFAPTGATLLNVSNSQPLGDVSKRERQLSRHAYPQRHRGELIFIQTQIRYIGKSNQIKRCHLSSPKQILKLVYNYFSLWDDIFFYIIIFIDVNSCIHVTVFLGVKWQWKYSG